MNKKSTKVDGKEMKETLSQLGFRIYPLHNPTKEDIKAVICLSQQLWS